MIAKLLLKTGLLQLGSFHDDGHYSPYRLRLDMATSYPQIMRTLVEQTPPLVQRVTHLLSAPDCIPFSSLLSQKLGLPLVYSRGSDAAAVSDLVGAYDVGHPTCLVINTLEEGTRQLIAKAAQGGLDIVALLVLVDTGAHDDLGIETLAIVHLRNVIAELNDAGLIPAGQAQAVLTHLAAS